MAAPAKDLDYYQLLLVNRTASMAVIRASYRTLMRKHHPDVGGDTVTAALLNKAYAVLSDARGRAEYDACLQLAERAGKGISFAAPPRARDLYRECAFCGHAHKHGRFIVEAATCGACDSPLFPAGQPRFERSGQRAIARIDKRQEISLYTQWPQATAFTGLTEDISLTGMRFETQVSLLAGQTIKIECQIVAAIALVSNISRRRRGLKVRNVAGVAFLTLRLNHSPGGFVSEKI